MNLGPIHSHLREILVHPTSRELIVVGGASILLKRDWLARKSARTLITELPSARATGDLDFALSLDLFTTPEKGKQVREMIDQLGYTSKADFMQFVKNDIQMDLMSRMPNGDERKLIKVDRSRVGSKAKIFLHGMTTPEAFAVERLPITIDVELDDDAGEAEALTAIVAHPYGLINMKIRAAHDRFRCKAEGHEPKQFSQKHALDVYALVAAMTEKELAECEDLSKEFATHPIADEIRHEATTLFSTQGGKAFREAEVLAKQSLEHGVFWDALQEAIAIQSHGLG